MRWLTWNTTKSFHNMKKIINKKTTIGIVVIVVLIIGSQLLFSGKDVFYEWVLVERGNVSQEVSATGQVIPQKKVNLQFEVQGKIQKIKAEEGEEVRKGDILMALDVSELVVSVAEAEAARNAAKASLEKILAGATPEEIRVYEAAVGNALIALENAQVSLKNSRQDLTDVQAVAQESIDSAYEDALNVLDDSYIKIYNAFNAVDLIKRTYFNGTDQESLQVKENQEYKIEQPMVLVKTYIDAAKENSETEKTDEALAEMESVLNEVSLALAAIRETCESVNYRDIVSETSKTSLDNQKSYIATTLTNVINSKQTISSTKISNRSSINTAQSALDSAQNAVKTAEGNFRSAREEFAKIKAPARKSDVDLARAKLEQAEAGLTKIRQQLAKTSLFASCDGVVAEIKKEEGEMVRAMTDSVVLLICSGNFQIEMDIPEVDIGQVGVGDIAKISLDAFPQESFLGKVSKIHPSETIIQGVVYYKVIIGINENDERIKPGMTADIDIIIEEATNTILVPQRAVFSKNGGKAVKILNDDGNVIETEVEIGIKGSNGEMEILSGLKEGDKAIIFVKEN